MVRLLYVSLFILAIIPGICFCGDKGDSSLKDVVVQEDINGVTSTKDSEISFQAKKAIFNKSDGTLEMRDHVNISTDKGLNLKTDRLNWNQKSGDVITDLPVKITKQGAMDITGKGLNVQTSLKTAEVEREVTVKVPQSGGEFIMITCKGPLDIDYQEGKAVFYNDVKVNQKDAELFSDKATVYFDMKKQVLDKVVAEGNVRIVRGKDTSFSKKAIYEMSDKKIRLEGNPRLVIFSGEGQGMFK